MKTLQPKKRIDLNELEKRWERVKKTLLYDHEQKMRAGILFWWRLSVYNFLQDTSSENVCWDRNMTTCTIKNIYHFTTKELHDDEEKN